MDSNQCYIQKLWLGGCKLRLSNCRESKSVIGAQSAKGQVPLPLNAALAAISRSAVVQYFLAGDGGIQNGHLYIHTVRYRSSSEKNEAEESKSLQNIP